MIDISNIATQDNTPFINRMAILTSKQNKMNDIIIEEDPDNKLTYQNLKEKVEKEVDLEIEKEQIEDKKKYEQIKKKIKEYF